MNPLRHAASLLVLGTTLSVACSSASAPKTAMEVSLATDSARFAVQFNGSLFTGRIGYTLTNASDDILSMTGCHAPRGPNLEKQVNGSWIVAYDQIFLLCRTIPDFTWQPGTKTPASLDLFVAPRGTNIRPQWNVDTIDGVYRLHWYFAIGPDPTAEGARMVEVLSNTFRLSTTAAKQ